MNLLEDLFKGNHAFNLQFLSTCGEFFELLNYKLISSDKLTLNNSLFK